MSVSRSTHWSPQSCSRCNPITCICWCHDNGHTPLHSYIEDSGVSEHVVAICTCSEFHEIPIEVAGGAS